MHFKNILKIKKAQSTVEYVTILAVVLGLFLLLIGQVQDHLKSYQKTMAGRIATEN